MKRDITLLDVLIDGFEKNECMAGFHWRDLPMPDEAAAAEQFEALFREAAAWKGPPIAAEHDGPRRFGRWDGLEVRQAGRGIRVLARRPNFDAWWHDDDTWRDDPMGPLWDWPIEKE